MRFTGSMIVLLTLAGGNSTARADIQFCFSHESHYEDAGKANEDFWLDDGVAARRSRGIFVIIYKDGELVFIDFTGDGKGQGDPGKGCTPMLRSGTGDYTFGIASIGKVRGNFINAIIDQQDGAVLVLPGKVYADGAMYPIDFRATAKGIRKKLLNRAFSVYNAAALAFFRHGNGKTGETYTFHIDATKAPCGEPSIFCAGGAPAVYITQKRADNKFLIVHEMGHAFLEFALTERGDNDLSEKNQPNCPQEAVDGSHDMLSKEFSSGAMNEGFAHFYAADTFNNHDNNFCRFEYYKPLGGDDNAALNCENASPGFPEKAMETNCSDFPGYGTELDYLRTFWDVHTDDADEATMQEILNWMEEASKPPTNNNGFGSQTTYDQLEAASQSGPGAPIQTNWDNAKDENGIIHPGP